MDQSAGTRPPLRDRLIGFWRRRSRPARIGMVGGVAGILVLGVAWARCGLAGCPDVRRLTSYQPGGAPVLLDRDGKPFADLAPVEGEVVPLESLPPHVPQAFIAAEDRRFYEHGAVDLRRVMGALLANLKAGRPTPKAWSPPSGVIEASVDPDTGLILAPGCQPLAGPARKEVFVAGNAPRDSCPSTGEPVMFAPLYEPLDEELMAELPPEVTEEPVEDSPAEALASDPGSPPPSPAPSATPLPEPTPSVAPTPVPAATPTRLPVAPPTPTPEATPTAEPTPAPSPPPL